LPALRSGWNIRWFSQLKGASAQDGQEQENSADFSDGFLDPASANNFG